MSTAPSINHDPKRGTSDRRNVRARHGELTKLFDKQPPQAPEAECAVLGSMIQEWRVCGEVLQFLEANDFYLPAHVAIYQVLVDLYDQNQSVDVVQLHQRLKDRGQLDQVGGLEYLIELAESVPSAATAGHYARIVHDKSRLRKLIETAGAILHDAYHCDEPVGDVLDKAESQIFEIAEHGSTQDASRIDTLLHEFYERLETNDGRLISGQETGFYELDELTNGLQNSEMIVVAARPSMGKTAFALNIAEYIGVTRKQGCLVFSLEMSKQQLAQRLLCSRSGVDSHKLRRNLLGADDFAKLQLAVGELSDAPVLIDDSPGLSLLQLRAKTRRLIPKHDIKAVFVDYLQLMNQPGHESRQAEVSAISRGIKALAREVNVPVVCMSQLNRSPEGREGHRPRMSDLRESGSIEQDADVVLMLHREDYYHHGEDGYEESNVAEVIITKQRNGPTGNLKLQFQGPTMRFQNLASSAPNGEGPF